MLTNIVALDLGKGSLGIAISRSGMFITPLNNIRFHAGNYDECISMLKEILSHENVEHFVVGLPLFPSGDSCEMTKVVTDFIKKLEMSFPGIDIVTQDERNTTVEASEILHGNGKKSKKQKKNIDSIAATVILERYLRKIGQY